MLRSSAIRRIVPQAHAMIPQHCKIRGHLYRPSRLNFYCRLASTTRHQRSFSEEFLYNLSLNSDVGLTFIFAIGFCWGALMWGYCMSSYSLNSHKNKQFTGNLNVSERFQRNADMQRIFDNHSKRIAEASKDRGIPIRDNHSPCVNYYVGF